MEFEKSLRRAKQEEGARHRVHGHSCVPDTFRVDPGTLYTWKRLGFTVVLSP